MGRRQPGGVCGQDERAGASPGDAAHPLRRCQRRERAHGEHGGRSTPRGDASDRAAGVRPDRGDATSDVAGGRTPVQPRRTPGKGWDRWDQDRLNISSGSVLPVRRARAARGAHRNRRRVCAPSDPGPWATEHHRVRLQRQYSVAGERSSRRGDPGGRAPPHDDCFRQYAVAAGDAVAATRGVRLVGWPGLRIRETVLSAPHLAAPLSAGETVGTGGRGRGGRARNDSSHRDAAASAVFGLLASRHP